MKLEDLFEIWGEIGDNERGDRHAEHDWRNNSVAAPITYLLKDQNGKVVRRGLSWAGTKAAMGIKDFQKRYGKMTAEIARNCPLITGVCNISSVI